MIRTAGVVLVVAIWIGCLAWLAATKIVPPLSVGQPPERIAVTPTTDEASVWTVHWNEKNVGIFVERRQATGQADSPVAATVAGRPAEPAPAETTSVTRSRLTLNELPLGEILAQVGGPLAAMALGPEIQTGWSFDVRTVTVATGDRFVAMAGGIFPVEGPSVLLWRIAPSGDRHRLDVYAGEAILGSAEELRDAADTLSTVVPEGDDGVPAGPPADMLSSRPAARESGLTALGRRLYTRTLAIPPGTLVRSLVATPVDLGPLRVGQSWTIPVESPLTGGGTTLLAATVEEEQIAALEGDFHRAYRVVYRRESGRRKAPEADLLVEPSGRVLEQTIGLGRGKLTLRRAPPERVLTLTRASDDPDLWAFAAEMIDVPAPTP